MDQKFWGKIICVCIMWVAVAVCAKFQIPGTGAIALFAIIGTYLAVNKL